MSRSESPGRFITNDLKSNKLQSLAGLRWEVLPQQSDDIVTQLLLNRGIKNKDKFLEPSFEQDLHDPFLLPDIKPAIKRTVRS